MSAIMLPSPRLAVSLARVGLYLADVPTAYASVADDATRRLLGGSGIARLDHLMDGRAVFVRQQSMAATAGWCRAWFLVGLVTLSPSTGSAVGPVWIQGGPLRRTMVELAELSHGPDCEVCARVTEASDA